MPADLRVADVAIQALLEIARELKDLPTCGGESGGSPIKNLSRGVDAVLDLFFELALLLDLFARLGQSGSLFGAALEEAGG